MTQIVQILFAGFVVDSADCSFLLRDVPVLRLYTIVQCLLYNAFLIIIFSFLIMNYALNQL